MASTGASGDFAALFTRELEGLDLAPVCRIDNDGCEPFVDYVKDDLVGLALSGGGIRSATFSLGVLEGLSQLDADSEVEPPRPGILRHFTHLSTVSGGGYLGGWWSAWRGRVGRGALFPGDAGDPQRPLNPGREPKPIRHLRYFSNFLAPRLGFFEIETWQFVSAVLIGLVPSALAASALIVIGVMLYLALAWCLMRPLMDGGAWLTVGPGLSAAIIVGGSTWATLFRFERICARREALPNMPYPWVQYGILSIPTSLWTALCAWTLSVHDDYLFSPIYRGVRADGPGLDLQTPFCEALGCHPPYSAQLSVPFLAWAATLIILIVLRLLFFRLGKPVTAPQWRALLDRIIGRTVALVVAWLAGLLILNLGLLIRSLGTISAGTAGVSGVGLGAIVSYVLRRFALQAPAGSREGGLQSALRVLTPQVLAYIALALIFAGMTAAVLSALALYGRAASVSLAVGSLTVTGVVLCLFNPNEAGLHPFYRGRIARAYLGASNFLPPENLQTTPHPHDDIQLKDLPNQRPLHLVSLTANDLAGDPLANFSRGARSATLSRTGFAVGNRWWNWKVLAHQPVSLASAMTASGAAVNSNMGSYSSQLGVAVTFLLAALNIRLGYWLQTTRSAGWRSHLPGGFFFRELFAHTFAGAASDAFHLSDGGHFENMGLYELLRRRCRYILAVDCGADGDGAFDDLGNAIRRARADFSIEIDLDLNPLRKNSAGFSRQHAAVGDIVYSNRDRGVIIVIKPALVGEEPDDVLQYHSRNTHFPHESTGDQLYDEAQWESYRRLGQHAARTTFRFIEKRTNWTVQDMFGSARMEWYPAPATLRENALARSAQASDIERQLAALGDVELLHGVYPELPLLVNGTQRFTTAEAFAKRLPVLIQMMQLVEDVFVSCELEQYWNHPLNMGWMNYFGRWLTAPAVRTWWPVLSPMYNRNATRFAEERFGLPRATALAPRIDVPDPNDKGVATRLWLEMRGALPHDGRFAYVVTLDGTHVELAVAFVTCEANEARWDSDEFFVPPSFWGAGIGTDFLKRLLARLRANGVSAAEVTIKTPAVKDEAHRKEHADLVQMYRQEHFESTEADASRRGDWHGDAHVVMRKTLR